VALGRKDGNGQPRSRLRRFARDDRAQALTEYVILTSVMVAVAAYLYYPDNEVFRGIRRTYNKTTLLVGWPGP
jgi:hypothetical protein